MTQAKKKPTPLYKRVEVPHQWTALLKVAVRKLGVPEVRRLLTSKVSASTASRIIQGNLEPKYHVAALIEEAVSGCPPLPFDVMMQAAKDTNFQTTKDLAADLGVPYPTLVGWLTQSKNPRYTSGLFMREALPVALPGWLDRCYEILNNQHDTEQETA